MLTVHPHPDRAPVGEPLLHEAGDRALRVLVVDDHPAVCAGVLQLLKEQRDLSVVDAVGSAEAAMSLSRSASRSTWRWSTISLGRAAVCG